MAKPKNPKTNKTQAPAPANNLSTLMAAAVQSRISGTALYSTKIEMAGLISHPNGVLVEYNESAPAPDGRIPFRATEVGMNVYNSGAFGAAPTSQATPFGQPFGAPAAPQQQYQPPANAAPTLNQVAPNRVFTFKKGIPIPPKSSRGRSGTQYGFEQMEVGDAFDVLPTAENPNPAKRIVSTVASASKRMAPKAFVVRAIEENGIKLARVWRSA